MGLKPITYLSRARHAYSHTVLLLLHIDLLTHTLIKLVRG